MGTITTLFPRNIFFDKVSPFSDDQLAHFNSLEIIHDGVDEGGVHTSGYSKDHQVLDADVLNTLKAEIESRALDFIQTAYNANVNYVGRVQPIIKNSRLYVNKFGELGVRKKDSDGELTAVVYIHSNTFCAGYRLHNPLMDVPHNVTEIDCDGNKESIEVYGESGEIMIYPSIVNFSIDGNADASIEQKLLVVSIDFKYNVYEQTGVGEIGFDTFNTDSGL